MFFSDFAVFGLWFCTTDCSGNPLQKCHNVAVGMGRTATSGDFLAGKKTSKILEANERHHFAHRQKLHVANLQHGGFEGAILTGPQG